MSVDRWLSAKYSESYNCYDFARDVYLDLAGRDIGPQTVGHGRFERLRGPVHPCLVLMRGRLAHVGVYWRGRVLHLSREGVHYQDLEVATLGYQHVRYYRCKPLP